MRPIAVLVSLAELAAIHRAAELLDCTKSQLLLESALATSDEYISSREGGAPGNPGHVFWSAATPQSVTGTLHVAPSGTQLQKLERACARVRVVRGSDVRELSVSAFIVGATLRVLSRRMRSDPRLAELRVPYAAPPESRERRG